MMKEIHHTEAIIAYKKKHKMTQATLAQKMGISRFNLVQRILVDKPARFTEQTIKKMRFSGFPMEIIGLPQIPPVSIPTSVVEYQQKIKELEERLAEKDRIISDKDKIIQFYESKGNRVTED